MFYLTLSMDSLTVKYFRGVCVKGNVASLGDSPDDVSRRMIRFRTKGVTRQGTASSAAGNPFQVCATDYPPMLC